MCVQHFRLICVHRQKMFLKKRFSKKNLLFIFKSSRKNCSNFFFLIILVNIFTVITYYIRIKKQLKTL